MTPAGEFVFRFGEYILFHSPISAAPDGGRLAHAIQPGMIGIVVSVPRNGPTSVSLRDLSHPMHDLAEAVDLVIAAVPRPAGASWLNGPALGNSVREDDHPGLRLLSRHLSSLAEVAQSLAVPDGIAALEAAILLAAAVYQPEPVTAAELEVEDDSRRKAKAIQFIDKRLMDPTLTIDSLAIQLGVSRATLFRDFALDNGVKAYIRARRLALARQALHNRTGRRPSIAEIAHAHGFSSESHFSRAYSLSYGHTPGSTSTRSDLTTPTSDLSEVPDRIGTSPNPTGNK